MMFTASAGINCFIILKLYFFLASLLFRLINANISVNEQPEWFHWAHRRWQFYTYLRHDLDHCSPRSSVKKLMTGEVEKTRNLGFISYNITLDFLLKKDTEVQCITI